MRLKQAAKGSSPQRELSPANMIPSHRSKLPVTEQRVKPASLPSNRSKNSDQAKRVPMHKRNYNELRKDTTPPKNNFNSNGPTVPRKRVNLTPPNLPVESVDEKKTPRKPDNKQLRAVPRNLEINLDSERSKTEFMDARRKAAE